MKAALCFLACAACTVVAPPANPDMSAPAPARAEPPDEEDDEGPAPSPVASPSAGGDLTPHGPVECDSVQHVELVGVYIEADGRAINAHGACSIVIRGSHIVGATAIDVHGGALVEISDSTIEGSRVAVDLHGSAVLTTANTTYVGGIDRHGTAVINDQGGNRW